MPVISKNLTVSKQELLTRFIERVRTLVVTSTGWDGTEVIRPGVTLSSITSAAAQSTASPPAENLNNLEEKITANINSTQSFVRAIRDIMVVYAKNNKISVRNTGNSPGGLDYYINSVYQPGSSTPNYDVTETNVARMNTDFGTGALISSDVTTAANTRNLNSKDLVIDAQDLENFFTDCRSIWSNRCNSTSLQTYDYNYCHGSFNSHASHSSRGRR